MRISDWSSDVCSSDLRQLEVFKRTGDNAHQIRAMLTQEKVADTDKHFRIVGVEAYCAAGGTFTTDLFGERRYCDDAGLFMDLVQDRLDAIAKAAREDGWRDAEGQDRKSTRLNSSH